jgi:SpoU rRNA methylase family protein
LRPRCRKGKYGLAVFAEADSLHRKRIRRLGKGWRGCGSRFGSSGAAGLPTRAIPMASLLVGGGKQGLSGPLQEIADYMVRIPMQGACDSLNVSVAAGVLLFEMSRRRPKT